MLPLVTEHNVQSSCGRVMKKPTHIFLEQESVNLSLKGQIVNI